MVLLKSKINRPPKIALISPRRKNASCAYYAARGSDSVVHCVASAKDGGGGVAGLQLDACVGRAGGCAGQVAGRRGALPAKPTRRPGAAAGSGGRMPRSDGRQPE